MKLGTIHRYKVLKVHMEMTHDAYTQVYLTHFRGIYIDLHSCPGDLSLTLTLTTDPTITVLLSGDTAFVLN